MERYTLKAAGTKLLRGAARFRPSLVPAMRTPQSPEPSARARVFTMKLAQRSASWIICSSRRPFRKCACPAGSISRSRRRVTATKPHVVLLHGLPNSSRNFRGVIGPLSRSAFVVAPDLPGFGDSDVLPQAHLRGLCRLHRRAALRGSRSRSASSTCTISARPSACNWPCARRIWSAASSSRMPTRTSPAMALNGQPRRSSGLRRTPGMKRRPPRISPWKERATPIFAACRRISQRGSIPSSGRKTGASCACQAGWRPSAACSWTMAAMSRNSTISRPI